MAAYEQELGTALFRERAAELADGGFAVLSELGDFAQAPRDIPRSLDYPVARPGKPFEGFVQFVHSAFLGENELQAEHNQALCSSFINKRGEQLDGTDQHDGKGRYARCENWCWSTRRVTEADFGRNELGLLWKFCSADLRQALV